MDNPAITIVTILVTSIITGMLFMAASSWDREAVHCLQYSSSLSVCQDIVLNHLHDK